MPRRLRFVAPARGEIAPGTFAHPVFADYAAFRDLLEATRWPALEELNARRSAASPVFVAQTPALLADGLHYEARIAQMHRIATREDNWHDLLNSLVWLRYPVLKHALNARQVSDLARVGPRERTLGQCALTLFDEGGLVVIARDLRLLDAWDRHDWPELFGTCGAAWREQTRVLVFGHALLEHALDPEHLLVGKALAIATTADPHSPGVERDALAALADRIAEGRLLLDPKELRAFPVSGLEGWHRSSLDAEGRAQFLQSGECFRPIAAGRRYPSPFFLPSPSGQLAADSLRATLLQMRAHGPADNS